MHLRTGTPVSSSVLFGFFSVVLSAALGLSVALAPAEASTPIRASGSAVLQTPFELTDEADPGRALRWQACDGIEYRIDSRSLPTGVRPVIDQTMRVLSRQTGVEFRYAGGTTRRFDDTTPPAEPTIFFTFTSERSAYGENLAWPGEVGVGGPVATSTNRTGSAPRVISLGRVLISTAFTGAHFGPGASWQSVITHEVGHALNLGHRPGEHETMNAALTAGSPGRFQPDEVAALRQVLQRTGCTD